MKIRRVGPKLFRADGWTDKQTDMTKLIVTFRNFANAPKKLCLYSNRRSPRFRMGANQLSRTAVLQIWPPFCVSDNGDGGDGEVVPVHAMKAYKGK